jgi:two-component system response regulator QseB
MAALQCPQCRRWASLLSSRRREPNIRILIVEDDNQLGDALANGLRQLGHVVDWFRAGREADGALATTSFDAVVVDLGLPGGDGLTWLSRWRARKVALPVLILTARDGVQQRIAGLDGGADDYLIKPITIDELAARLRALVRRSSGQSQAVWSHGLLEYDPAGKVVRWNGVPIELAGRELAILEVLLLNPGRVLAKSACSKGSTTGATRNRKATRSKSTSTVSAAR